MIKNGFTLIELMVAVVVLSILLGIAVPSYWEYVVRSRLTEAFDALSSYRVTMEQSYLDNGNYGVNACSIAAPATENFSYQCGLTNAGQGFLITANGNAVHNLTGYNFTLSNTGARQTTAFPKAAVPANCWLTKHGGC